MRHTRVEILSTPACAACVATKVELTQAGIAFTEVKPGADPVGAADIVARYVAVTGEARTTAPLVLVSDETGEVIDAWAGRVDGMVNRVMSKLQ